jgi:predicted Zn-dependent peptidase
MMTLNVAAAMEPPATPHDLAVLSVFNSVMSGGMSTRYFSEIRERNGLVYSVRSYFKRESDAMHYVFDTWMTPDNAPTVLRIAARELTKVAEAAPDAGGLTERELRKAIAQAGAGVAMMAETSGGRGQLYAHRWTRGDPFVALPSLVNEMHTVTLDEVRATAQRVLDALQRAQVVAVAPKDIGAQLHRALQTPERGVA